MLAVGFFEWAVFWSVIAIALVADAATARSGRVTPSVRSAVLWSAAWIALGIAFGVWVALHFGGQVGLTYFTAYALEKSLSIDNVFVFALIFSLTGIPPALQRRALFWGIAGALIMRAVMIWAGVYLLARFHWVVYPFAALLAYAAVRMFRGEAQERKLIEATCGLCTSWVARFIPISPVMAGRRFLVRKNGRLMATPLLVALAAIEMTDILFAVDSIPAVLAVTREPFLVYSSNVFALLGLRSLYFVFAGVMRGLRFLRAGLGVMLLFAAVKMLLAEAIEVPPAVSLAVIVGILAVSVAASRFFPVRASDIQEKNRI